MCRTFAASVCEPSICMIYKSSSDYDKQDSHKPGIVGEFCKPGKGMEKFGNLR